jgi:hypothetical protein
MFSSTILLVLFKIMCTKCMWSFTHNGPNDFNTFLNMIKHFNFVLHVSWVTKPNFNLAYATFWLYIQDTYMVYKKNMLIKTLVHVYNIQKWYVIWSKDYKVFLPQNQNLVHLELLNCCNLIILCWILPQYFTSCAIIIIKWILSQCKIRWITFYSALQFLTRYNLLRCNKGIVKSLIWYFFKWLKIVNWNWTQT